MHARKIVAGTASLLIVAFLAVVSVAAPGPMVVESLRGIVLLSSADELAQPRDLPEGGILLVNLPAPKPDKLKSELTHFLDQPLYLETIEEVRRRIINHYRGQDRPVVNVAVPEQDITEGVLSLIVTEGRLGKVRTEGNTHFSGGLFESHLPLKPGDPIRESKILESVDWYNQNPFISTTAIFTPGDEPGETDLLLEVEDSFPWMLHLGYEDTGNDVTRDERWYAGLTWGNVLGLGHTLRYEFRSSFDVQTLNSHLLTYRAPLPWHHTLFAYGQVASSSGAKLFDDFYIEGDGVQAGLEYSFPLPDLGPVEHEAFLGFQYKQYDNAILFGQPTVFSSETEVLQFPFGYRAWADHLGGRTQFDASVFCSPGNLSDLNTDEEFDNSRIGAESDYVYGTLGLRRAQSLPGDWLLLFRVQGQWTTANLLPSEQFPFGGYNSVRGYEYGEVRGDSGFTGSLELRAPSFSLGDLFFGDSIKSAVPGSGSKEPVVDMETANHWASNLGEMQFLAFFDYGLASIYEPLPGEDDEISLAGVGLGFRYILSPTLTLRFDYGWQLEDTGFNNRYDSRAHIGVSAKF